MATDQSSNSAGRIHSNYHQITHNGETHTVAEWARILELSTPMLYNRLTLGWSVQRTLETPNRSIGGLSHKHPREYKSWEAMWRRCTEKNKNYSSRGITVCERWEDFSLFLQDMGQRPSPQHSIDRVESDGNYEPGNCRWATKKQQSNNRRNNVKLTLDGVTLTLPEWSDITGLSQGLLRNRVLRGWSDEQVLKTAVEPNRAPGKLEEQMPEVVRLYEAGKSVRQLQEMLHSNCSTIKEALLARGVKLRTSSEQKKLAFRLKQEGSRSPTTERQP